MKEDILFVTLKDKPVLSSNELKKKYKDVNVTDLRMRIINYQVMKYGYQLTKETLLKSKKFIKKSRNKINYYEQ